jgi:hypothetical protein
MESILFKEANKALSSRIIGVKGGILMPIAIENYIDVKERANGT